VLAIAWTIRALGGEGGRYRQMAVSGFMAALACGTKYTAVTVLVSLPAAAAIVWFWQWWTTSVDPVVSLRVFSLVRQWLQACIFAIIVGCVVFSPWLIRNLAWSGNPVFPMAGKLLGQAHFDDVQTHRWDAAHRARPEQSSLGARFKALGSRVIGHWQFGYVLFPASLVTMLIWLRRPPVLLLTILFAGQVLFWVFFTHLQPRFAVLITPVGAIAIGACLSGRLARTGAAVALLSAVVGLVAMDVCFRKYLPLAHGGLFRNEDLTFAQTPQLKGAEHGPKRVAMIGEGQPFFVQMPSKNLSYRTVFDVRFEKGKSPIESWLGQSLAQLRANYDVVIIHPGELRRLASTYADVPPLSDDWLSEVIRVYNIKPPYPQDWSNPDAPVILPLAR